MDDNNFFNSYKKKFAGPGKETGVEAAPPMKPSMKYEEKSGFVAPPAGSGGAMPTFPKRKKYIIPVIIAAIVVLAVIIGLVWYFTSGTEMTDFTGWTLNDAKLWASEHSVTLQVQEEYNDQADAGKVISQSVPKGTRISSNDFVRITVSLGHDLTVALPLPDLKNMTQAEVEAWAAQNFMAKVRFTTEFSNTVPSGSVIRYEINDNTVVDKVTRNTPIYVIVSKGSEDAAGIQITVPDFKQKSIAESYVFANENGIVLNVVEQYDDYVPKGSIIAQSVKAQEKVSKGSEIKLTVSKGKMITVPSFSGYSKQKATAVAGALGIPVTTLDKYSTISAGAFVSQSIKAGTVYEEGTILELCYSLGNKIVLPSFVGQTKDAIEGWAKELNDNSAGITINTSYTQNNASKGKIIYQDPANTLISVRSAVNITVSLGKVIFIPDFVGPDGAGYDLAITREEALAMCEAVNIIPVFVAESHAGRLPGEIWSQSIAAGTEASEETNITLKYNPANVQVNVPSFIGMTKTNVTAGGYFMQLDITFVDAEGYVDDGTGKVYQQSLTPNTTVAAGTPITLHVGPAGP
jgi:beta-lactam-binding protein with PASTA domain